MFESLGGVWTVVASFVGYWAVYAAAGPLCLRLFAPLRQRSRKQQMSAFIRVPSMLNCLLTVVLALRILVSSAELQTNRVSATTPVSNFLLAIAFGYFLFDVVHCLYDWSGPAFMAHGIVCSIVYGGAWYLPFVHYYGAVFLLYEGSTIFLNIGYFVKSVYGYPLSSPQMMTVNILFALTFFSIRIVFGTYKSYQFFIDMTELAAAQGGWSAVQYVYGAINLFLGALNYFWLSQIFRQVLGVGGSSKKVVSAKKSKKTT